MSPVQEALAIEMDNVTQPLVATIAETVAHHDIAPEEPPNAPAVLVWSDLMVSTKRGNKVLLNKIKGKITGGFWSVMGPSGSGKSTLLNALACRLDKEVSINGEVRLNGRKYSTTELKAMSGYVMQDDLLNAHLTVEETLWYSAELRLPNSFTTEQRQQRVEEALVEMGLVHARNVIVGNSLKKGISGGERKRLCVAIELLTHPLLLFLDEPTSGLDSVTALSLCEKLKELADSGKTTVVCTIHQPQSKIFKLFSNLILLRSGEIVYLGNTEGALKFFEGAGFPLPPSTNPADHLLDVITPSLGSDSTEVDMNQAKLNKYLPDLTVDLSYGDEKHHHYVRNLIPWRKQYYILFLRSFQESWRRKDILLTTVLTSLIISLLIGLVFLNIGNDQKSVNKRQAVLFFCVINQGIFGALQVINSFPHERALILRERAAGTYHVSAYFMAKITVETIFQMPNPLIFSFIVYWLVGLQPVLSKFLVFLGFMVLCTFSATSLALFVSTVCKSVDLSVTVLPIMLEVNRLFGGFFLPPNFMPKYFEWLDAMSYVKYTYTGIALNELHDLEVICKPNEFVNGKCLITSGQQRIDQLGLDYITMTDAAFALLGYIVFMRVGSYLALRCLKH